MSEKKERRIKGDGSVYQRKDGRWVASFKGKTRYAGSAKEAKQKLNELKRMPDELLRTAPQKVSTKTYFANWLSTYKKNSLKPASYDRLETTINNQIVPVIGDISFVSVTADDCQNLINELTESGASFSVVKKAYDALSACFKHAILKGDISKNPMDIVNGPSSATFENQTDVRALTLEEEGKLLKELDRKWVSSGKPIYTYRDAFIILLNTGLREGELVALDWDDVDLDKRVIHVRKNAIITKERGKDNKPTGKVTQIIQSTPKTKRANRDVALNKKAMAAFHSLKNKCPNSDYVLTTETGERTFSTTLNKQLARAYKRCNIANAGVHTLRHTFASKLFSANANVKMVSELLGHSNTSITYNTYIHIIPEMKEDVVGLLDD